MKTRSCGPFPLVSHAAHWRLKRRASKASARSTCPLPCGTVHTHLTPIWALPPSGPLHLPVPSQMPVCPRTTSPHISLLSVLPLIANSHVFLSASRAFYRLWVVCVKAGLTRCRGPLGSSLSRNRAFKAGFRLVVSLCCRPAWNSSHILISGIEI